MKACVVLFGRHGLALAFLVLLFAPGAHAAARLYDGVPYARGLKLDIYVPETKVASRSLFSRGRGVVVYIHGGGWIHGDRKHVYDIPRFITSLGYIFVAMDYRLVPETTIDGQLRDTADAVRWVEANIASYGGDPGRVALMGHSAGAHLDTMLAVRHMVDVEGVISDDVQAYDMVAYSAMRGGIGYPFVQAFGRDADDWIRWSPATYARGATNIPPHLLMHSGSNGERRRALTRGYANLLRSRGTRVTVFDGGRYNHGTIARYLGRPGDDASAAVARFLRSVIGR